ncbi:uncharacterized protein BT62DRAFT_1013339 [Guyanagaster necrorhizus]|uniref:Uncharacterized protein n=1 Tax=Guyanagaster necrorhizus TaxID=856835 RepID=A0A9P7VH67_9AGAR|nr:uncharacterized protein BT62DRAFT_1013339 [Guyanagaster necrorhizus MCA 3950]KAG7439889.1 hypothetical protein BT62DRAFT_1013339 [Guyanagaster necrorhizus MCA 3950]
MLALPFSSSGIRQVKWIYDDCGLTSVPDGGAACNDRKKDDLYLVPVNNEYTPSARNFGIPQINWGPLRLQIQIYINIAPPTILSMNVITAGSRIFFYDSTGRIVRGVVENTSRMADGTQIVLVKSASVFRG